MPRRYAAYRSGARALGPSEAEQIGFRVAAALEHPTAYPVDVSDAFFDPYAEELAATNARLPGTDTHAQAPRYPGPDMVAAWYRRNLRILSHLHAITEPGDRLLIVYGQGHIPGLRSSWKCPAASRPSTRCLWLSGQRRGLRPNARPNRSPAPRGAARRLCRRVLLCPRIGGYRLFLFRMQA